MPLWVEFVSCVNCLRKACTRRATFMWMTVVLVAWAVRPDLLGVTSLVRASFLQASCYPLLLNFFHSDALVLPALAEAWTKLVMRLFVPVREGGYVIFVADGLKIAKEGKKMPAVKCLHQESGDNSKAEYIMGHSFQVVSLLVTAVTGQVFAVPLIARICEGLLWARPASDRKKRKTLLDKLVDMFLEVTAAAEVQALLVADAYYASRKIIEPLLAKGYHLVSRVRRNAVAFESPQDPEKRKRGRPKKYGRKVRLRQLFKAWQSFVEAPSPVYGEQGITIQYRYVDLLWRPVGRLVRFVLVKHPTRGNIILLSTDITLDPIAVIRIYGLRFKIEVSFKQAIHTLGAYAYHFWMKEMTPISRGSGDQPIHRASDAYRKAVERKMGAYHRYVQLACVVQGLLQHLAINYRQVVWAKFRSWLRTMKPDQVPSEMVVAQALKSSLPEFLLGSPNDREITKFILDHAEIERTPGMTAAAA